MDLQKLAIATISWARNEDEEKLLRLALKQLSLSGIPVFITDGGSPEAFINYMRQLNKFTVLTSTKKGLWPQVETSLQYAVNSGATFIIYTEPDKPDFFNVLPQLLYNIQVNEKSGVVLASRTATGMASFPAFQQITETTINKCCAEVIGQDVDYTYGPFLLNKIILPHLHELPDDIGWGWRPYAFNIAARLGLPIAVYEGDYYCNVGLEEDTAAERLYRMKQLAENITALILSSTKKFAE